MINMRRSALMPVLVLLLCGCRGTGPQRAEAQRPDVGGELKLAAVDVNDADHDDLSPFLTYLKRNGAPPVDYVVGKFSDHDVVILGEIHEVREYLEFVSDLIPALYHRAGVRCLATEFLRHRNTALANRIVTRPEYDEAAVVELYRDYVGIWGFREYMDVFKAIWALNNSLPPEAEKFRVVGLDGELEEYDVLSAPEQQREELMQKLWERDEYMAGVFVREALQQGGKALLHTGYMHSFLRYRLPVLADGELTGEMEPRLGGLLSQEYGDRVFQVCLHQWHFSPELFSGGRPTPRPVLGGLVEKAMAANGGQPLGFDVEGSPFANLRDRKSCYFAYQDGVVFVDLAQGYVFIKPVKELTSRCTWVKGFIVEGNFEKARGMVLQRGWIAEDECTTPEELDERIGALFGGR